MWTIRPHPADPQHASLSTLDQVGESAGPVGAASNPARTPRGCCHPLLLPATPEPGTRCHPLDPPPFLPPHPTTPPPAHWQDLALGIFLPPPFDRVLKRISCNQVRAIFEDVKR